VISLRCLVGQSWGQCVC